MVPGMVLATGWQQGSENGSCRGGFDDSREGCFNGSGVWVSGALVVVLGVAPAMDRAALQRFLQRVGRWSAPGRVLQWIRSMGSTCLLRRLSVTLLVMGRKWEPAVIFRLLL